jgi:hypothetical protein
MRARCSGGRGLRRAAYLISGIGFNYPDGCHLNDHLEFRWINIVLSSLKASFTGTFNGLTTATQSFGHEKYSKRDTWKPSATGSTVDST